MRVVKTPRLRGPASLMSAALPGLRSSLSFPESRAGPAHGGGRARSRARLVWPRIRAGKSSAVGASASGGQRPGVLCCRGGQRGEGARDLFEPGRGYPVPAVTPWPDGKPEFAQQSTMRTLVCPAQCRCVVCGTEVAPGPIYRPADGEEAEFVAVALRFGKLYRNTAPTREGAGHRSCMIYSAIVCPYLASPGARRKFEIWLGPEAALRGDPRGPSAAVVGTTTTPGTLAIRGWTSSDKPCRDRTYLAILLIIGHMGEQAKALNQAGTSGRTGRRDRPGENGGGGSVDGSKGQLALV
jgi:hypothetical protein